MRQKNASRPIIIVEDHQEVVPRFHRHPVGSVISFVSYTKTERHCYKSSHQTRGAFMSFQVLQVHQYYATSLTAIYEIDRPTRAVRMDFVVEARE